ncbi:wiskott-Aldrich syndrome protein family member 1-like [Anoplophora glabripennis]|uniref:wiskott-Aldrich syndrome protein family member 1-like n=1 Tax=Anoplophora glabripennis TaxID=217634 RepID=UPI000C761AA5|nr:wiskott-Aldrich syndrome protein family member 1-like [Anoplophora glabripennis]
MAISMGNPTPIVPQREPNPTSAETAAAVQKRFLHAYSVSWGSLGIPPTTSPSPNGSETTAFVDMAPSKGACAIPAKHLRASSTTTRPSPGPLGIHQVQSRSTRSSTSTLGLLQVYYVHPSPQGSTKPPPGVLQVQQVRTRSAPDPPGPYEVRSRSTRSTLVPLRPSLLDSQVSFHNYQHQGPPSQPGPPTPQSSTPSTVELVQALTLANQAQPNTSTRPAPSQPAAGPSQTSARAPAQPPRQ